MRILVHFKLETQNLSRNGPVTVTRR